MSVDGFPGTCVKRPSYKARVEIAIPYPAPTATNFGYVNGSGISENLSYLTDREHVTRWYENQVISMWDWLGFDGAIMQPSCVFDNFPEKELGEAAAPPDLTDKSDILPVKEYLEKHFVNTTF